MLLVALAGCLPASSCLQHSAPSSLTHVINMRPGVRLQQQQPDVAVSLWRHPSCFHLPCNRYKKGELNGKNVSIIMPPPFSTRHPSYMRSYVNSSKSKILDSTREVCCALTAVKATARG
jgi:hypothetical protein